MLNNILSWCDTVNPQPENEKLVIRYGAELLVDNLIKLLVILAAGVVIGKGIETGIHLLVFCSLRTQAGGVHARTKGMCTVCMVGIWIIVLTLSKFLLIPMVWINIFISLSMIWAAWAAPVTINRDCYSIKTVVKKKVNSVILIVVFYIMALYCQDLQNVIICSIFAAMIMLFPGAIQK